MKQTLTIRLAKEQIEKLKEIASKEDTSMSAIIRGFTNEGLKKRKINTKKKRI